MPCTTIMAGRKATYDGSTLMARNEDSGGGKFCAKKLTVVLPEEQPRRYKSVISGVEIDLPENPLRYTAMPNALPDEGIWGEAGFNDCNVAMSETETITSNPRVLGADPLVPGGIGEEDMLTITLPYIRSAREGVLRLGALLEQYGTYEKNGIGFQDAEEIWWLETIGGHHWMARRVPDDAYMLGPNQQGIDRFDMKDALGEGREHLCSADLADFVRENHLDLGMEGIDPAENTRLDARAAFGSRDDADHTYNTPRAWAMGRRLNPHSFRRADGSEYGPEDDDIPWCLVPEKKLTVEEIKYVLSLHFQGTEYDPYGRAGDGLQRGRYRVIGINRNNFVAVTQLRPGLPAEIAALEWIAVGSNVFNQVVPFYANAESAPEYLANATGTVTTENFYWANRIIAALADAHFPECANLIERYQLKVMSEGRAMLKKFDAEFLEKYAQADSAAQRSFLAECNKAFADMARKETDDLLDKVLFTASNGMKNAFKRSDA